MAGIKGKETVTIKRVVFGAEDKYGNKAQTYIEIPVNRCLIAWGSTGVTETLFQTQIGTEAVIQFPKGTKIELTDLFILPNGKIYEINGSFTNWVTQVGSPINPKVLVEVKNYDG